MDTDALIRRELEADAKIADLPAALRDLAIGAIYGLACMMLGAAPWKAVSIGALIWACLMIGVGRHAIMRAGLLFVPYAILFWIGAVPDPATIRMWACR